MQEFFCFWGTMFYASKPEASCEALVEAFAAGSCEGSDGRVDGRDYPSILTSAADAVRGEGGSDHAESTAGIAWVAEVHAVGASLTDCFGFVTV